MMRRECGSKERQRGRGQREADGQRKSRAMRCCCHPPIGMRRRSSSAGAGEEEGRHSPLDSVQLESTDLRGDVVDGVTLADPSRREEPAALVGFGQKDLFLAEVG
jgi:hypothetical protein